MASGYKSTHPMTEELLKTLGIPDSAVSQGWGSAKASAGFHQPEGKAGGRKYSSCFDLRWNSLTETTRDRLTVGGVCVFPRDWAGNQHHHCVHVGLRDDKGQCKLLPGPRQQIIDYTIGRSGLAGHGPWQGKWRPDAIERAAIQEAYAAWVPDIVTRVYLPNGKSPTVYAFLEGTGAKRTVTCEARAFVEALGGRILEASQAWLNVRLADGKQIEIDGGKLAGWYVAGEFLRAPVRQIAEAMGYGVTFEWAEGKSSVKVLLTQATAKPVEPTKPAEPVLIPHGNQKWAFDAYREANGDIIAEGIATTFDDHTTRTGYAADKPGRLACSLPRGNMDLTEGSPFKGVPDFTVVRVYNPVTKKQVECPVIDEGPAYWATAGTGKKGSAMIDLTPAAKLALGFKTENTNGKVRIRIIANSAQRGKAALK